MSFLVEIVLSIEKIWKSNAVGIYFFFSLILEHRYLVAISCFYLSPYQ